MLSPQPRHLRWPDGATYVGDFRGGEKHGRGAFTWPDGGYVTGAWADGQLHGEATYRWADGRCAGERTM